MDNESKNNILQKILFEAQAYNTFEDIEKLVDGGVDLSVVPIQPLYISLISSTPSQLATVLPKLSKEQRQAFIDLDLWKKDIVDPTHFEFWIESYSRLRDDQLVGEFSTSEDFYLYLKSRVNIYTFDAEDPMYPDHDFYFLTDDNLLLIEYGEDYQYPGELKVLIRSMYDILGVEGAYTTLFKLMNDSFSKIQEEGFQNKKERLREYGFVDYFEASEKLHPFATYSQVKKLIKSKGVETGAIDLLSQNQSLHSSALVGFNIDMENILSELSKVKDDKRKQFLHFTFLRLINSTITLKDALKGGRVELTKIGAETKSYLELGLLFLKKESVSEGSAEENVSIFERFDFFDLYKIGVSLIGIEKKKLKKSLIGKSFETHENEYFIGSWWTNFLENSFLEIPKVKNFGVGLHAKHINDLTTFEFWKKNVALFCSLSPFIEEFSKSFMNLKDEGKLQDSFYINYDVSEIDFEAIIISSFINFALFKNSKPNKLGVSIVEFKSFYNKYSQQVNGEYILKPQLNEDVSSVLSAFCKTYGFENVEGIENYLYGILNENISGYEFDTLEEDDFQHVGGPILLILAS